MVKDRNQTIKIFGNPDPVRVNFTKTESNFGNTTRSADKKGIFLNFHESNVPEKTKKLFEGAQSQIQHIINLENAPKYRDMVNI